MRRLRIPTGRGLVLLLGLAVLGIGLASTLSLGRSWQRHYVADFLGVGLKNDLLATYTLLTAPVVQTDDLVPIAHDDVPPYAVNVFLDQEVQSANVARSLDLIRQAGFHFIKQELVWNDVERPFKRMYVDSAVAGKSSWANYDLIVDQAEEHSVQVIFRIDTSPPWARPGTAKIETPPENFADYGDFVAEVVQRYKGRVHYYQIWNEPNWAFEWGDRVAQPAEYVRMLRIASGRARAVDPSVVILAASLAPTIENSERAVTDVGFLQQMYDGGAAPYFDVLSANAYGLRNGPNDWRFNRQDDVNFSRPVLLREIMVQNGDASKPIWASEIGWDALPVNWNQLPLLFGSVSRDLQAAYTVQAYQRAASQWPWMDVMAVWHFRKVHPADAQQQDYYFDLVSNDWQTEPVYDALRKLMAAPPVVHRGYHQENYWALNWSPGWQPVLDSRASLGQLNGSSKAGATLSFDLDASWLDLVTTTGPSEGQLAVTIDGSPFGANRLPIVHREAILSVYSPAEAWQTHVPLADNLGPGTHHVEIRALGGHVAIDGIVADRESPRAILVWRIACALVGFAFLAVTIHRRPPSAVRPGAPPESAVR